MTDPFREYHRARGRAQVGRVALSLALVVALGGGLTALTAAAPAPPPPVVAVAPSPSAVDAVVLPAPVAAPVAPVEVPASVPPPVADPGSPRSWSIAIDTTGYQVELDECLWVRTDLGIQAPIVGAHNHCGGSVVLDMQLGDTVALAGTGLDGTYVVTAERDARAGDNAAAATAGFEAAVILQTCYWSDDGSERLLALLPVAA